MRRVTQSIGFLHTQGAAKKALGWDALILATENEINRIESRSAKLHDALKFFKQEKEAGHLCPEIKDESATQS